MGQFTDETEIESTMVVIGKIPLTENVMLPTKAKAQPLMKL